MPLVYFKKYAEELFWSLSASFFAPCILGWELKKIADRGYLVGLVVVLLLDNFPMKIFPSLDTSSSLLFQVKYT